VTARATQPAAESRDCLARGGGRDVVGTEARLRQAKTGCQTVPDAVCVEGQLRLTSRQRLELFIPVCLAIQHAHQKGVIHRNLKSSNVLFGLYDRKPVPKVIDFGVVATASALATVADTPLATFPVTFTGTGSKTFSGMVGQFLGADSASPGPAFEAVPPSSSMSASTSEPIDARHFQGHTAASSHVAEAASEKSWPVSGVCRVR
jgi:serine/threonine protein kinase